jgi:hypothetical protein
MGTNGLTGRAAGSTNLCFCRIFRLARTDGYPGAILNPPLPGGSMQIRITKTRAAMAALFVLAGVGLWTPGVGKCLAAAC